MTDKPREECGVFGIHTPGRPAARLGFFGLYALQHRGQEAAGMVSCSGGTLHVHKDMGLVSHVFNESNLSNLRGELAIGHTRYSTTGSASIRNVQPYEVETSEGPMALSHNGNITNAPSLRRELLERGIGLQTSSDTEVLVHLLAAAGGSDWLRRIASLMARVEGGYALTILTQNAVYGVRDPWGLRPLVLGRLADGGHVLASESCAFAPIGATFVSEVGPGQVCRIDDNGYAIHQLAPPQKLAFCTFEEIYFARPDSVQSGRLVHQVRQRIGAELAVDAPVDADIVIPVPDSGIPHAIGYAARSEIPFSEGLIKSRYIGRTFIEPTEKLRASAVAMKFNPLPDNLEGKRVIVVDDSIVRGTTSGPLVRMLRKAGASEVHMRVSCPPIRFPCFMGIDMADAEELIAARMSVDDIAAHIGADSLAYLSLEALMRALEATDGYCNACFTGDYPFETAIQLELLEKDQFAQVWGSA